MKKNDKIVVLLSVVVIVIAAIGIFTWSDTTPDEESFYPETEHTYKVTWNDETVTLSPIKGYTTDGKTTTESITISQDNLMSVTFSLSWKDDKPGLVGLKTDKLTLEVVPPQGESQKESKQEKVGNITKTFNLNTKPSIDEITAKSESEALDKLREYTEDTGKGEWKAEITVNVGKFLLSKGLDKGNDWELTVTYTYYKLSSIDEDTTIPTGDDIPMRPSCISTNYWLRNLFKTTSIRLL